MSTLLITNGTVITVDPSRRIIRDGAVLIDDGAITAVGKAAELGGSAADKIIDARGNVVMPGFIDTHHHHRHTIVRGMADDVLLPVLAERNEPTDEAYSEEDMYLSAMGSCIEQARTGTTCVLDTGGPHMDSVGQALVDFGMRGVLSYNGTDYFEADLPENRAVAPETRRRKTTEAVLAAEEEQFRRWNGAAGGRIRGSYGLGRDVQVSEALYRGVKKLSDRDGTFVQLHFAVSEPRVEWMRRNLGHTPVEYLHHLGVLDSNWLFVHCVYLTDHEVDLCAQYGVRVSHAPGASVHGTYGAISRGKFPELLEKGVTISLSTDAAVADNTFDKFRIMYLAATLHKEARMIPDLILPEQALEMATINGARALMWDDEIGSIEEGKRGDVIIVDTSGSNWRPLHDWNLVPNLVYSGSGDDVLTTVIDGKVVMEDRNLLTCDAPKVLGRLQEASERLFAKMPFKIEPRWRFE